MKLFKKFLLVAGAVGLVSSFGFANKAMAAGEVTLTYSGGEAKATVAASLSANSVNFELEGTPIKSVPVSGGTASITKEQIKDAVNASSFSISSLQSLKAKAVSANNVAYASDAVAIDPLYQVRGYGDSNGSVSSEDSGDSIAYGYVGDSMTLVAEPYDDTEYEFNRWTDSNGGTIVEKYKKIITVTNSTTKNIYTASFKKIGGTSVDGPYFTYVVTRRSGATESSVRVKDSAAGITLYIGDKVTITVPDGYKMRGSGYSDYFDVSGLTFTAKSATPSGSPARVYAYDELDESETSPNLLMTVVGIPKITTSDFVEYITDGYTLEFKAKASNSSQNIVFGVVSDYKDYVDSFEHTKNSDTDKTVTVKVKFKEKLDKGNNNKEIKLAATVDGVTAKIDSDTDTDTTKKVTIYSRPTASFSTSDRKITYKVPSKVNTSATSGKESDGDEKDNTLTKIAEVKGVKVRVYNGDTSLGFTSTAKSSGTSSSLDASTVESIIVNLSSKFSGESATAKFRLYPNDSDGKYNKEVYADTSAAVYRAVITYTDESGKTGSVNVYGLEGQTIDAATIAKVDANLKNIKLKDADGKDITSFKMGTSASVNDHTGVLGASRAASDSEGLDRVPKTGQNNAIIFVMVAIVAAAVCAGLYFYNKKAKNI